MTGARDYTPMELTIRRAEQKAEQRREIEQAVTRAPLCECDTPLVYEEADGERRCICGRAARCERHREGLDVTPGQWSDGSPPEAA